LRVREQQLFGIAFVLSMALFQQPILQSSEFVLKIQLQVCNSLILHPMIQAVLSLAAIFPLRKSRHNMVEIRVALGSPRNSSFRRTCSPRIQILAGFGYGLYDDISPVLGLANDIRN
jgi:hypothetical protein